MKFKKQLNDLEKHAEFIKKHNKKVGNNHWYIAPDPKGSIDSFNHMNSETSSCDVGSSDAGSMSGGEGLAESNTNNLKVTDTYKNKSFKLRDNDEINSMMDFMRDSEQYKDHPYSESLNESNIKHLKDIIGKIDCIYITDDARVRQLYEGDKQKTISEKYIISKEDVEKILDDLNSCDSIFLTPREKNDVFRKKYNLKAEDYLDIIHQLKVSDYFRSTTSDNPDFYGDDLIIFEPSDIEVKGKHLDNITIYVKIDVTESVGEVVFISVHEGEQDDLPYKNESLNEAASRVIPTNYGDKELWIIRTGVAPYTYLEFKMRKGVIKDVRGAYQAGHDNMKTVYFFDKHSAQNFLDNVNASGNVKPINYSWYSGHSNKFEVKPYKPNLNYLRGEYDSVQLKFSEVINLPYGTCYLWDSWMLGDKIENQTKPEDNSDFFWDDYKDLTSISLDESFKNKYIYDGPVFMFDRYVGDTHMETMAVSEGKAISNICSRLKTDMGYEQNTRITIDRDYLDIVPDETDAVPVTHEPIEPGDDISED